MVTNLEGEIWKPVVGFEGKYEISDYGRIRSLNYRNHGGVCILTPTVNHAGYLTVTLTSNRERYKKRIHRLVYEAFVAPLLSYDPKKDGSSFFEINHIDEDKTNNRPSNLELVTHTENVRHGTAIERKSATQTNGKKSKKVYQYDLDGVLVKIWPSFSEIVRSGISKQAIWNRCNPSHLSNKTNVYVGYIWSYTPLEKGVSDG